MRLVIKRNNEQEEKDYEEMLIHHKRRVAIIVAVAIVFLAIGLYVVKVFLDNRIYQNYEVVAATDVGDVAKCEFYGYGDGLLRYSNDGISYLVGKEEVWNQAFEMKEPVIDICESYMAIADLKGNTVYIYNKEGQQGKIESSNPILDLEVAAQGVVALISETQDTNVIEIYDKEGTNIAMGQTLLEGDGCPLDITLSNDATKLAVSYVYLESNVVRTKVVFYNYSEVGKNKVGRIVGGFEHYEDTIISKVEFLNNDVVAAFGDNVLTIYEIRQEPSIKKEFKIDKEIESILYSEEYMGIIMKSATKANEYIIQLYNTEGKLILEQVTDFQYKEAKLRDKMIILNNSEYLQLISTDGVVKYNGKYDKEINKVISTSKENKFLIITNDKMEEIRMN